MANKTVPILLLTGYLGSGKTTLVNHILSNERGIKFAVIVNDIGEVNIDASLIQKGGVVDTKDDSLVPLQNGCICCTLKMDLLKQIDDILATGKFDYIIIEASGICEPVPIAQTITTLQERGREYFGYYPCRLDSIITVVDALRLQSEFNCGNKLIDKQVDEEDIENLIIQQIEFCNLLLLNKKSEVEPKELARIKQIIHTLNPGAKIIECDYANVNLEEVVNTGEFDFDQASLAAGWVKEFDRQRTEEEEAEARRHGHVHHEEHEHEHDEEHGHHHHHEHHHHEGGEVEEYGIGTFVYYRRPAFDVIKFNDFLGEKWEKNIIRAKGICYFKQNPNMSYLFEQAGVQKKLTEAGQWFCTAPDDELAEILDREPSILNDWDDEYGDKMQKIVFIGQNIDKEKLIAQLDACLAE
ncbi:MAG: GTP-binding protein [Bacteroidales bacterium]|nr:GTP-binding protein [Bacteroidales bacterium]